MNIQEVIPGLGALSKPAQVQQEREAARGSLREHLLPCYRAHGMHSISAVDRVSNGAATRIG
jgi:hypothetical protein